MDPRLASRVFLALGVADLALMNLLLAPRLAAHEARPAPIAVAPVAAAPSCPPAPAPVPAQPLPAPRAAAAPPVASGPAAPDVLFHFDGQRLGGGEPNAELGRVALALRDAPDRRLLLRGHADRLGSPERNVVLSRRRADAVRRYLVALGAPGERIDVEPVGDAEPVDTSDTPEAWARNRRVQVLWR
jgi:OOP family OmpA-OmpF porin